MPFLDFDTLLICNNDLSKESVLFTFDLFKNIGVKNFIFTYDYDRELRSVSSAVAKFRTLKPYLRSLAPQGVKIYTAFNVILSDGLVYDKDFSRLSLGHSERIFISIPYDDCSEWFEADMNHLLYRNKQKPAFVYFQSIRNSQDVFDRLTTIKNSIFALDLNYLTSVSSTEDIYDIVARHVNIVPCITHNIFEYVGILKSMSLLQNRIAIRNYFDLCNIFRNSSCELIKDATFYPGRK